MTENSKRFYFGKIDFNGIGRNINAVEVDFSLKNKDDGSVCFTVSCEVWNHIHTDSIAGGQMLDELPQLEARSKLFCIIKDLWQKYHLNDTHAGTPEQENALKEAGLSSPNYDFTKACKYLKSIGLYEVEYEGKPYRYGSGWINYPIPKDDLDKIYLILKTPQDELEKML